MAGYEANESFLGATVGRYANRIGEGKFSIDEKTYTLSTNNGSHHLHGGLEGFDRKLWKAETLETADSVGVRFSTSSPDGEDGYPGEVVVTVDYVLNNKNELVVEYRATTDKPTHLNLTNHSYWNLSGAGQGTIFLGRRFYTFRLSQAASDWRRHRKHRNNSHWIRPLLRD